MIHFKFNEADPRYLFLKCDTKYDHLQIEKLKQHINLVDPICYLPTYTGPRFTQDFLFTYVQPSGDTIYYCAIGLWQVIYKFFDENKIEYDGLKENQHYFKRPIKHTFEEFKEIVDSWGLKYTPRPYQYKCAYKILQWKSSISKLATRAGKTMLAYIVFRYAIEYLGMKRILMIVPSIDLVKQGYNDFNEYGEFFKTECIWGGGKLVESANMTIGTFQSLIKFLDKKSSKYNPSFFDGYDCVFVDETHRATAAQIKTIISQPFMKDVKVAFGMTGTIPKEKTIDFYCLHALLGAKIQEINPKELMDGGYISNILIHQVHLNYPDSEEMKDLCIKCSEYAIGEYVTQKNPKNGRNEKVKLVDPKFLIQYYKTLPGGIVGIKQQLMLKDTYKDDYIKMLNSVVTSSTSTNSLVIEKMMSHFCPQRLDYLIYDILPKCDGNTLILAHHVEYIKYVYEELQKYFPERHIAIITGAVSGKLRDNVKKLFSEHDDCILVASYACVGTGLTIPKLRFGVLFESFKSNVINMQSLGRGLGLVENKDKYEVYDIIDCFDKSYSKRKLYLQGREKIKIYKTEQYNYDITEVKLK
jgi:superfamily II DNA or RNA helicase